MDEKLVMLIADDVDVNRASLKAMFEREYQIVEATDGEKALNIMEHQKIDVVILDINMPIMDGEAVLSRMKADSELRDIPIIIKTSMDENKEVRMLEMGADDFIFSPCEPGVIVSRVTIIMQKYVMRQRRLKEKIKEEQYANRVKGMFIDRISEEIYENSREILALCEENTEGTDTDRLDRISRHAKHMLTMAENVLELSWSEGKEFVAHMVSFQIQNVVVDLFREYSTMCMGKDINFQMDMTQVECENLVGDCEHLKQIWSQMLKKAYRYTDAGGEIKTAYAQRKVGAHQVELELTIQGKLGVNDGYPVTKSFVELLHGKMEILEEEGEGIGAVITLPFRIGKEPLAKKRSFAGMCAIVIDDNEYSSTHHIAMLSRLGITCDVVENGEQAMQQLQTVYAQGKGYDFCFVNWYMLGAEDIIREIRSMYTPEQMIICCSMNKETCIEEKMKDAGVDYVMKRPIHQETLYRSLKEMCEGLELKEREKIV